MLSIYIIFTILFSVLLLTSFLIVLVNSIYDHFHQPERHYVPRKEKPDGSKDEKIIANILIDIAHEFDHVDIINNVIIPAGTDSFGNKKTVEIDHIFFTVCGLFVIETKSYRGTIFGKEEDDEWCVTTGYMRSNEKYFYNPIRQNDAHIKAIKQLFPNKDIVCFSCVVFKNADIRHVNHELVIRPHELKEFIVESCIDMVYDNYELDEIIEKIQYYKDNPPKTIKEHIKDVKKIQKLYEA